MRGLAAIAVVLFHYLNFFIPPGSEEAAPNYPSLEPLHAFLWPFYDYGLWAVQLFWLISGFVFAATYAGRQTTGRRFLVARIARLYPLHLLTLCVVAALQYYRLAWLGSFQIFQTNDLYHFVLNLFFASYWGLQRGLSFNAPIWSVSVEVAIYAAFWITLKPLYRKGVVGPIILSLAFTVGSVFNLPGTVFWQCGFYFFLGSAINIAYPHLRNWPWLLALAGVAALGAGAALVVVLHQPVGRLMPVLLPGMILIVCAIEAAGWARGSRWTRWIGDNSYGVYLWHIPVQLVLLLVLDGVVGGRTAVTSAWFLALFVGLVVGIARLSYLAFERPAQEAIRRLAIPGA
ncbi:acyltransferase [Sphingomonas oligophenolica]